MKRFEIDILNQHWIDGNPDNTDDPCSHGSFLLKINGQVIMSPDDKIKDWTTNTSVLRLLRTIDNDFLLDRYYGIILHCGMIEMISCPISLDWLLWHNDGKIFIKDIKKYLSTKDGEGIEFPDLLAKIPRDEYKREIVKAALQVKDFYASSRQRTYYDDLGKVKNLEFWKEFDSLVFRHS